MRDSVIIKLFQGLAEDEQTARRTHQIEVSLSLKAVVNLMVDPPAYINLGKVKLLRRRPTEKDFEKEYNRLKEGFMAAQLDAMKRADEAKRKKREAALDPESPKN